MLRIRDAKLGRVLAIYASASFAVLQGVDLFQGRLDLPPWTFKAALTLLIIGLPVVVTTAIVQSHDFKSQLVEKNFTWRRALGGGAVAFIILLGTTAYLARDRFGGNEELDPNLIAVFPFRVNGADPSLKYLSEGMLDLLAAKLSGETGIRAADPRTALAAYKHIGNDDPELEQIVRAARSIGARNVLLGEVVGTAAQLTISAAVINTRTGRRVQHMVIGPVDSIATRVDELAAVLLSLDAGEPRDRMAALTTTSLPALRSYLAAEASARQADHSDAMRNYLAALDADSSFALAALGVIVQSSWSARTPPGGLQRARDIAFAQRDRLSELDRLKLTGYIGSKYPQPEGDIPKCKAWNEIAARAPDRAEAWHNVGDCFYHFSGFTGAKDWQAQARVNFEKSLALDSTFLPNLEHLIPLAVIRRDLPELRKLIALAERQGAEGAFLSDARWYVKYLEHRPLDELLQIDSLADGKPNAAALLGWRPLAISGLLIRETEDFALADTLVARAIARARANEPSHDIDPIVGASIALRRGQHADALRYMLKIGDGNSILASSLVITAAMYSDLPERVAAPYADSLERRLRALPDDSVRLRALDRLCALEQWRLWHGDASQAERTLRLMRSAAPDSMSAPGSRARGLVCAQMLEAIRATVQKRPEAVALAQRVDSISAEFPSYSFQALQIRLVASRLLEINGKLAQARDAAGRFALEYGASYFYPDQVLQEARLSAKLGDRESAVRGYRKYLALRAHADSSGQITNRHVQHELALITGER